MSLPRALSLPLPLLLLLLLLLLLPLPPLSMPPLSMPPSLRFCRRCCLSAVADAVAAACAAAVCDACHCHCIVVLGADTRKCAAQHTYHMRPSLFHPVRYSACAR